MVVVRLLAASALLGVVIALGFEGFETVMHQTRDVLWHDLIGNDPAAWATIGLATLGGLVLGLALRFLPGHGGDHPADGHALIPDVEGRVLLVVSTLAVGFVSLVAGASLGPEGAIIPAAAGISLVAARWFRLPGALPRLMPGVGVSALLAAMFGSPLAGAVPLLEMTAGAAIPVPLVMVVLPSLTASATAAITLQVLEAEPSGFLPLGYEGFARGHLLWAVVLGVVAGATGLAVARLVPLLRTVTRRIDRRSIVLTATLGGFVLGVLYVIGGPEVRFAGIPEILILVEESPGVGVALFAVLVKLLATAWCLAAGYRGGRIFPIAFLGAATGLVVHAVFDGLPVAVALGCGIAGALATGLGTPVTAALVAAAVLGPELLPVAIISVVVAHTVHLLAAQLAPPPQPSPPPASVV
jgi:H+/Cl- antiporter ClcA